jgi:dCMP deaminase
MKILFAGVANPAAADLAEIHDLADIRITNQHSVKEIAALVADAMSSVQRPSWDQYFIEIAQVVARRGNCMKRQVAAVVVKDDRVVATGYNGTPKGAKNCNEGGCERCNSLAPSGTGLDDCVCNHAEENAICQAAYHGTSIRDATLYCTHSPCLRCAKLVINAGIKEVVYNADYPLSDRAKALLRQCNVVIRRYPQRYSDGT